MDSQEARATTKVLAQLPHRLHHSAFVVRDQEENRKFFEDIIGLPLVATWCERAFFPDVKREVEYCHTFYGLADGGALAFFQFADADIYERSKPIDPQMPSFQHIALKVDAQAFDEIERRLRAAQVAVRVIDHGYCRSLYATSPDRFRVEFTVDPPEVGAIDAKRRADAYRELRRWLGGDHAPNNLDRH